MTIFYAQPYDTSAIGFYFESLEEYKEKIKKAVNTFGQAVEEFEIQFIDGEEINSRLFDALGLNQANLEPAIEAEEGWDNWQKTKVIIAVGECGYDFDIDHGNPDDFDIDFYEMDNMRELAQHFIDEGLFGDISYNLINYIDYEAIARDLNFDYSETSIAGKNLIYRCN
ncbi:MAG: antirestriction protein ArdA [Nitrospinales bacterium]